MTYYVSEETARSPLKESEEGILVQRPDFSIPAGCSAHGSWTRCTGACLLPVRSPCDLGMHFQACLEICDLHLSRSKETKYTGKKQTKPSKQTKKPTPPHNPSKWIFCSKIHPCPWESKLVRSTTISAGSSLESCFCIYAELPSPEQLSPAEGLQGI